MKNETYGKHQYSKKNTLNREKEHGQQITISHLGMDNKMF